MHFCRLLTFFAKAAFSKNPFNDNHRVSNRLDSDQARRFVGPDLVLKCLQRLSAEDTAVCWYMQRVKETKSATVNIFQNFLFSF